MVGSLLPGAMSTQLRCPPSDGGSYVHVQKYACTPLPVPPASSRLEQVGSHAGVREFTCGARGQDEWPRREIFLISRRQWRTGVQEDSDVLVGARMGIEILSPRYGDGIFSAASTQAALDLR